jgi:hypothetical protein
VIPTASWAAGSTNVTAFWAGNRCRELLQLGLPERLEPTSFQGARGFGDGGIAGFMGLQGIAMVLGNLEIALQLLRMVVVVSYFYYFLFYIKFGWCCDGVSNAKLLQRFCTR